MLVVQELDDLWTVIGYGELTFRVPRALVPPEVGPGDVIRLVIQRDEEASRRRRRQLDRLGGGSAPAGA